MSRKTIFCLSSIVTTLCIIYLAYEAKINEYDSVTIYFDNYINRAQKYLFNGCIYGVPIIFCFSRPYMSPEYRIRLKENVAIKLITKSIIDALFIGAGVMILFLLSTIFVGIKLEFGSFLVINYIRLVILYSQCGGLFYLIYTMVDSEIIAACSTIGVNMFALTWIVIYDFVFEPLQETSLKISIMYIILSCICVFLLLPYVISYRKKNI